MADVISNDHSRKRRKIHVDLTPMVDLGFLLITFFVFTSSMSAPKTMDLYETQDGKYKDVKASGSLTIIADSSKIYWYTGICSDENHPVFQNGGIGDLRETILSKKQTTSSDDLMILVKSTSRAKMGEIIDVLDEMTICGILPGHYAESDLNHSERNFLNLSH